LSLFFQLFSTDIYEAAIVTLRQEGILSLWRGWGPTVLRDVPFSCEYFAFFDEFLPSSQ
jgi:hypothetical protein